MVHLLYEVILVHTLGVDVEERCHPFQQAGVRPQLTLGQLGAVRPRMVNQVDAGIDTSKSNQLLDIQRHQDMCNKSHFLIKIQDPRWNVLNIRNLTRQLKCH